MKNTGNMQNKQRFLKAKQKTDGIWFAKRVFQHEPKKFLQVAQKDYRQVGRGAIVAYMEEGQLQRIRYLPCLGIEDMLAQLKITTVDASGLMERYNPAKEFVVLALNAVHTDDGGFTDVTAGIITAKR